MKRLIILFTIIILSVGNALASATPTHVIVVIAGGLSIRDIAAPNLPAIRKLMSTGSSALVNVRSGKPGKDFIQPSRLWTETGCMSIGAGAMAVGGAEVSSASNIDGKIEDVSAGELYKLHTNTSYGIAQVLQPDIVRVQRSNEFASYHAVPGLLGSILHNAKIKTAAIGNSDIDGEIHREAVSAAMDKDGLVDYGDVDSSDLNQTDNTVPYAIRSNTLALINRLDRVYDKGRFIVIDFGDTQRADSFAESCTDKQANIIRRDAVRRLDGFIANLIGHIDLSRDLLILVTPNSRSFTDIQEERLTPLIIAGPGFGDGLLTSPSTRHKGVVTISDISPTVAAFFGIKQPLEMTGRPIFAVANNDPGATLLKLNLDASMQAQRQPAMRGASIVQSVVVVLVSIILLFGSGAIRRIATWLVLIPIAIPLAMLYLPLIYTGGLVGAALLLIVLVLAILGICRLAYGSAQRAFVWLCGITVATLSMDILTGSRLIGSSIAGYSVVEGARYYGIGNELMGTMIGAAIIGLGSALSGSRLSLKARVSIMAVTYAFVFVCIGIFGAEFGGAVAAVPAMITVIASLCKFRVTAWNILKVAAATLAVCIGLFAFAALKGGSSQSHIGQFAKLFTGGDASVAFAQMQRKAALNLMLLSTSPWSRLLGLCLLSSAIQFWRGRQLYGKDFINADLMPTVSGCCVAIVGVFALNDSGVLAAATCAVFLWALISLHSEKQKLGHDSE